METKTISTTIQVAQISELSVADRELIEHAMRQTDKSYAPYSRFNVGAAVRLVDGSIIVGCNQENAAFGVTMCAERSALFAAGASHPDIAVASIAIAARDSNGFTTEPISPCGMCRQAMIETETRYRIPLRILLYGSAHTYIIEGITYLMPLSFVSFM